MMMISNSEVSVIHIVCIQQAVDEQIVAGNPEATASFSHVPRLAICKSLPKGNDETQLDRPQKDGTQSGFI
jgi:hypothetical protein